MEKKEDSSCIVGRYFADSDVNYYWSPVDAYGAKVTKSKSMALEKELSSGKVLCNKGLWLYDCGDNSIAIVKVNQKKGTLSLHQKRIIDFILTPKSPNEVLSLDEDGYLCRWMYKFKDDLQSWTGAYSKFEKPFDKIEANDSSNRIVVGWSSTNLVVWYFYLQMGIHKSALFYLPTEDFINHPVLNHHTIQNTKAIKIINIKDFVFSTRSNIGFILHDKNIISILDFSTRWIVDKIELEDFTDEIERIFYKDFTQSKNEAEDIDVRCDGTLILTAENNTILYTAEMFSFLSGFKINKNNQLVFKKDKTPKLIKFFESKNLIFLINNSMPYKMYWIQIDKINRFSEDIDVQALTKRFSYIYETSLSFTDKINNPVYFDCYLQEKKQGQNKFTFFLRDKSKINIFGIDDTEVLTTPSKKNEDFSSIALDEQANQSSKWKDLNLDKQNIEKYAQIEKSLINSSKMLRDYGRHSNPLEVEEQKDALNANESDEDELGQINERETESGGNNDKNQLKIEECFEEIRKHILDDEDEKQQERFENKAILSNISETANSQANMNLNLSLEISEKSGAKVKVVKYDINSNDFDEAGGDLDDSKNNSQILDKEENKDDSSFRNDDSMRRSTPSKSMIESEYQRNLIEKNKKRRNRLEREARGSTKHDSVEKAEIIEETKDQQPKNPINNRQNLRQMLNKGKSLIESKSKANENTNPAQEGKVNAIVNEEIKEPIVMIPKVEVPLVDLEDDKNIEPEVEVEETKEIEEIEEFLPEQSNKSSKAKPQSKPKQSESNAQTSSKPENKKKANENNKNVEVYEWNYWKVRGNSRQNKFEKSIEELVASTLKEQLPELLAETVKQNIAVSIVKQAKAELSGIHKENYDRVEKQILEYAEVKINESK